MSESSTYELSREHEEFRRSVREFAEAEIGPHAAQWDREHHFPVDVVRKMGALGLFGLTAPEEYGGAGEDGDFTSLCVAIEEIGRVDQSLGITLEAAVGLGINPILSYGTDEQRRTWLPDLVAGERLAGFGLTEPGAGSDAGATKTRAVLEDGEWVVNGAKQFITNSGSELTSVVTVTARTGTRENGSAEISTIIVHSGTPGFTAEKAYDKLGWDEKLIRHAWLLDLGVLLCEPSIRFEGMGGECIWGCACWVVVPHAAIRGEVQEPAVSV